MIEKQKNSNLELKNFLNPYSCWLVIVIVISIVLPLHVGGIRMELYRYATQQYQSFSLSLCLFHSLSLFFSFTLSLESECLNLAQRKRRRVKGEWGKGKRLSKCGKIQSQEGISIQGVEGGGEGRQKNGKENEKKVIKDLKNKGFSFRFDFDS